ncbi:MAG: patatin-like phospholipase family protein [Pseudomonadota bacterium]
MTKKLTIETGLNPDNKRIVLVLQGGGALGAYQAGVYHALHEHDLTPDWVVGTSIGAINAAIIAGNSSENRVSKLREFWDRMSHSDPIDLSKIPDGVRRFNIALSTADTMLRGVPGFFSPRYFSLFAAGFEVDPEAASFYDTSALGKTLNALVDFDYLNAEGGTRLTVNAMKVTTGELVSFDNRKQTIRAEHIMASGALPPGFPPVRLDGDLYWDGGLYSNTPLETVLDDQSQVDTLSFMVDLWSAHGAEPTTLGGVQTRQKDVMFASRSSRHIEAYIKTHKLQHSLRELAGHLTPEQKKLLDPELLNSMGADSTIHIVRLAYAGRDWNMPSKDVNFSAGSTNWRWNQGYRDASRAIEGADWLTTVSEDTALVVHELLPY